MSGKLRSRLSRSRHASELRFAITFLAIAGALFAVYSFPYGEGSWAQRFSDGYLRAYAHMAGTVLSAFEPGITVLDQNINGRYALRIVRGCDAIDAQILLVAAIVASHTHSWRWRIAGALVGLMLVTGANVMRISSLYYVGVWVPQYFDFFHHEFWPLILIVLASGAFLAWSRLASGPTRVERAPTQ